MCGIVGYIGEQPTKNFIIDGLKKLEYRGYDSAGAFLFNNEGYLRKCKGKVADLEKKMDDDNLSSCTIGMGHTRWATHGIPNTKNSHPHVSNNGKIFIVHNGIIENYASIKQILIEKGYTFQSVIDNYLKFHDSPEQLKAINARYGFDKPVIHQYFFYLNDISPISIHSNNNSDFNYLDSNKYSYINIYEVGGYVFVIKFPYFGESYQRRGGEGFKYHCQHIS